MLLFKSVYKSISVGTSIINEGKRREEKGREGKRREEKRREEKGTEGKGRVKGFIDTYRSLVSNLVKVTGDLSGEDTNKAICG